MFLVRSLISRFVVLAVVVLVAAGAGWWFFIREDNEAQKEAAPVTEAVRQAAAAVGHGPSPTATGTSAVASPAIITKAAAGASTVKGRSYRIVEGQSEAWYLAPEKLASLPTSSVAKGTTKDVKGEFHLGTSGLDTSKTTTFTVNVNSLVSNESRRDERVRSALETNRFPAATFTATSITGMPAEFTTTESVMQLTGTLELHGVKKEVTWELKAKKDASSEILSGLATTKLKYSDFNIRKPDIAGFVTVEDEVTLQVQLFVSPS
jgi:polyisoprenoid-binding protein YceI